MGWRTKLVFLLIVYCAGFATAVYYLAPLPEGQTAPSSLQVAQVSSALKAQTLIRSFNSGMHKCVGFSKEAARDAAKLIATKIKEVDLQPKN